MKDSPDPRPLSVYTHRTFAEIKDAILDAHKTGNDWDITFTDIPPNVGTVVCDDLLVSFRDHSIFPNMTYNSHTRKLIARIAKPNIFDIPRQWLNIEMEKMLKSDFLSRVEKSQLAGWDWLRSVYFDFFTGPYTDSRKSASWHLTPNSPPNRLPSIVAQTGWAEDLPNLLEDMELWLQGGYPHVKLVLLFAWSEQEESTACEIGVYERTSAGTTRERFHATVPPHTGDVEEHSGIPIMRSDLFGACDVPTECNPADIYNFSPARLRGLRIQREQEGKRERLKQRMNTLREMMYDSDGLGGGEE